jgi:uncharacterized protein GlcG (DUF336 family)
MQQMTLDIADRIAAAALAEGRRLALQPLTLVVLDAGGHVVLARREDNSGILRFEIAYGKAWGALGMGFGTRELAERAAKAPAFLTALAAASGGRAIPSPGGVLVLTADGRTIGSVGISGDTGDRDEACALVGIAAAGLAAAPGIKN